MKKNISSDNFYYYVPKINSNNKEANLPILSNGNSKRQNHKKLQFIGLKGSSTFDYLNILNRIRPKYHNISNTFLTKDLRNQNSLKNIERRNNYQTLQVNPSNKLRLSKNCELFHILDKTLISNKNSLKEVNTKELLGLDISKESIENNKNLIPIISQYKKFNINRSSLSCDRISDKNIDGSLPSSFDNNSSDINNKLKGVSQYYINFLYNQIFPKFFNDNHKKYNVVDNKLNIFYAENDEQFNDNFMRINNRLRKKGKREKKMIIHGNYVNDKLQEIKRKIGFVKGVSDYSIPSIILQKVKYASKKFQMLKKKKNKFLLPYEEINLEVDKIDKMKTKILSESMIINNQKSNFKSK